MRTDKLGRTLFLAVVLIRAAALPAAEPELSSELHPHWSPDGNRIVFESNRAGSADIYTMDLATGEIRQLTVSSGIPNRFGMEPADRFDGNGFRVAKSLDR